MIKKLISFAAAFVLAIGGVTVLSDRSQGITAKAAQEVSDYGTANMFMITKGYEFSNFKEHDEGDEIITDGENAHKAITKDGTYILRVSSDELSTMAYGTSNPKGLTFLAIDIVGMPKKLGIDFESDDYKDYYDDNYDENLDMAKNHQIIMTKYCNSKGLYISDVLLKANGAPLFAISNDELVYGEFNESNVLRIPIYGIGTPSYSSYDALKTFAAKQEYGSLEVSFKITGLPPIKTAKNISSLTAKADKAVFGYTGKAKAPTVTIKDGSYTLKQGTDYTLSYKNNKNIGTGTITVTGKGDYTGTKTLSFTIIPSNVGGFKAAATSASAVKLSWNKVSGAQGYIVYQYNTSTKKWVRIAKTGNVNTYTVKSLKAGTTYKYAIKAYKTVSGKDYTSAKYPTITTSTKPAKVSFKAAAASKAVKFSWSKVAGATNYIVYYRVKGTSSWKSVKVANNVTSRTISGLVKGKTYEVTVKAVSTVNKVNYNGAYDVKTVKVK